MLNKKWILAGFFVLVFVQLFVPFSMIFDQESVKDEGLAFKFKTRPVDPYDMFRGKYITLSYEQNTFLVKYSSIDSLSEQTSSIEYDSQNSEIEVAEPEISEAANVEYTAPVSSEYTESQTVDYYAYQNKLNLNRDRVFAEIAEDEDGFAFILNLTNEEPPHTSNYLLVSIQDMYQDENGFRVIVHFPFNRFYMNEHKAYEAELAYNESNFTEIDEWGNPIIDNQKTYALVYIFNGKASLENVFIDDVAIVDVVNKRLQEKESE